jgi:probable addiction module antidote protein
MRETQKQLNVAFKTGDRETICTAVSAMLLGVKNVTAFARKAGVDRTVLYRAFNYDPGLDLVLKVLSGLDFTIVVVDFPKIRTKPSLACELLNSAFDTDEIAKIIKALGETLRSQNVTQLAKKANLDRRSLYKSFTSFRIPRIGTVLSFLNAVGLRLAVKPRSFKR